MQFIKKAKNNGHETHAFHIWYFFYATEQAPMIMGSDSTTNIRLRAGTNIFLCDSANSNGHETHSFQNMHYH